jgi:hypothetical protein
MLTRNPNPGAARSHRGMRAANEELSEFNSYAAEQHARFATRFARHVATLQSVHSELHTVFQRVRALRGRLLERHPELAAALREHEASREAALEQERSKAAEGNG